MSILHIIFQKIEVNYIYQLQLKPKIRQINRLNKIAHKHRYKILNVSNLGS